MVRVREGFIFTRYNPLLLCRLLRVESFSFFLSLLADSVSPQDLEIFPRRLPSSYGMSSFFREILVRLFFTKELAFPPPLNLAPFFLFSSFRITPMMLHFWCLQETLLDAGDGTATLKEQPRTSFKSSLFFFVSKMSSPWGQERSFCVLTSLS